MSHLQGFANQYYPDLPEEAWCSLQPGVLFVAGTNLQGVHGAGAALYAKLRHGLKQGHAIGKIGASYGIPTREFVGARLVTLPLSAIEKYVYDFVDYTKAHKQFTYLVTPIGTGYAGYGHEDIAPMFYGAEQCWFPHTWREYLEDSLMVDHVPPF